MRTSLARFPFVNGLEVLNFFSYQPFLVKTQIGTLASYHFIKRGYRVLFSTAAVPIATRIKGIGEGT